METQSRRDCTGRSSASSAMPYRGCAGLLLLIWAGAWLLGAEPPAIDFNRDIRPILSDKCYACHGPDETHREADLRLDQEHNAKEDRGGYAPIVPGELDESELWRRVTTDDPSERMPPDTSGHVLKPEQRELLRRWIEEGAVWSQHWNSVDPEWHLPPAVHNQTWPANWIDAFVLARLEQGNEQVRSAADRITLVRRLCFDLTGLPPTPDQVERFLADDSPEAYERFVDSLLSSAAYGERMATYWLDLVRYGDTVGYHGDQDHPISPYRDYVINAFNANLPFDVFTEEQLAGDLLPNSQSRQKIASAYNRVLQTSHEGGIQAKEYRAIYAADRVRNVSAVWLAATLGCAQCHDHKYDPLTARDFYAMAAFFADIDDEQHFRVGTDTVPTARPPVLELLTDDESAQLVKWTREVSSGREELQRLRMQAVADGSEDTVRENRSRIAQGEKETRQLEEQIARLHRASLKCMITVPLAEPRITRILPRGNWLDETGPIVQPNVPAAMGSLAIADRRATRLDLAHWLTDPQHAGGRTARVFANRIWYLLLGRGISASLDDFGNQGTPPTHPELLDNLAIEFMQHDWDIKYLVKQIVLSRTYQQSSQPEQKSHDDGPPDAFAAGFPIRQRLPAEMVRDSALLVSGLLNTRVGGPSARPYQPEGYYRHLNYPVRTYQHDRDDSQWRRGVYIHWQRQFLHPMLRAFDAPSREECTAARPISNTPLAALALLNDPTFLEAARMFALRIAREGGNSFDQQIEYAYHRVLSREPDSIEREQLHKLWLENVASYSSDPNAAHQLLTIGQAPMAADIPPAELAAWTVVARVLFNLDEFITKS